MPENPTDSDPGGLQFMGLERVGHTYEFMERGRKGAGEALLCSTIPGSTTHIYLTQRVFPGGLQADRTGYCTMRYQLEGTGIPEWSLSKEPMT